VHKQKDEVVQFPSEPRTERGGVGGGALPGAYSAALRARLGGDNRARNSRLKRPVPVLPATGSRTFLALAWIELTHFLRNSTIYPRLTSLSR